MCVCVLGGAGGVEGGGGREGGGGWRGGCIFFCKKNTVLIMLEKIIWLPASWGENGLWSLIKQ